MRLARRDWRPPPLVLAIVTTIGAAGLVLYLQQRAMTALESQNQVIVRQLAEQTASDIAAELRRTLDGPIFDTLAAVNHPELRAGRLDLVAQHFSRGLEAYPHVDRFFAWSASGGRGAAGEPDVLFYGRSGVFGRDPDLGRAVLGWRAAMPARSRSTSPPKASAASPGRCSCGCSGPTPGGRSYFAVLGFVVEPASMRERLFAGARGRAFDDVLLRRGGEVPLQLRITDDAGELVYGTLPPRRSRARGWPSRCCSIRPTTSGRVWRPASRRGRGRSTSGAPPFADAPSAWPASATGRRRCRCC